MYFMELVYCAMKSHTTHVTMPLPCIMSSARFCSGTIRTICVFLIIRWPGQKFPGRTFQLICLYYYCHSLFQHFNSVDQHFNPITANAYSMFMGTIARSLKYIFLFLKPLKCSVTVNMFLELPSLTGLCHLMRAFLCHLLQT